MPSKNCTLPNAEEYVTLNNGNTIYKLISLSHINDRIVEVVLENQGIRYCFRRNRASIKKYIPEHEHPPESFHIASDELTTDQIALWFNEKC